MNHKPPTRAAAFWLLFLGPLFFIVYNTCNWYTAQRLDVSSVVFSWEKNIPFTPWLILPYMSIDAFFATSVFLCKSRQELNHHAYRIIAAIVISAGGFLLFPLQFTFEQSAVTGFNGMLFNLLHGFDKPYNQAPSLHISLLIILWVKYSQHLSQLWRGIIHFWFALIAVSVMGVYQHHFIDIITGAFTGVVCLYLFPNTSSCWKKHGFIADKHSKSIGRYYALGAVFFLLVAIVVRGFAWLLLWPSIALGLVAVAYLQFGPAIFQKSAQGKPTVSATIILWPYLITRRLVAWWQLQKLEPFCFINPQLAIGGINARKLNTWPVLIDLTAEFAYKHQDKSRYICLPVLDLTVPPVSVIQQALAFIQRQPNTEPICIHCALGLSRSATIAAAWLVKQGLATNAHLAFLQIQQVRPHIVWHVGHEQAVDSAVA